MPVELLIKMTVIRQAARRKLQPSNDPTINPLFDF
jgi:hypothetical protein